MEARQFDTVARTLAGGLPRRQLLGLLARGVLGGVLAFGSSLHASAQPGCRKEGHPCEGNQTCCAGLICAPGGQGASKRCTASDTEICEGDCPTDEPVVAVVAIDIDIEADCAYSGEMRRTTCTFTAAAGDGTVSSVIVPRAILCADVVGGDFEEITLGAADGTSESERGLKSTRTEGPSAVVTVELDGEVTTAATATYWCETDRAELIPVTGPGLSCAGSAETPVAGVSDTTGAVVVHSYDCDVASATAETAWFDVCRRSTTQATFQLTPTSDVSGGGGESKPADSGGMSRFEHLSPGAYRLQQTDADWCHAESDNVNEQGDVIVEAGAVVAVWIFHCIAPK